MSSFYGVELTSRLLLGTSRYPSPAVLERAVKASGAEVVTVSLRRECGADTGPGVEPRDSGTTSTQTLRQRALRNQLQFELPRQHLPLKLAILPDVGGDHLAHLPGAQEQPHAEIIHPGVVAHDREPARATVAQRSDEVLGNPAEAEATRGDGLSVTHNPRERGGGVGVNFVHNKTDGLE